jgi:GNAT superfamily N-acetyltransferase
VTFTEVLTTVYCKNPCQVLPNALWKTLDVLHEYNTVYELERGGVTSIKIWNDDQLLMYWTRNRDFTLSKKYIESVSFMLIHQDYLKYIPVEQVSFQKPYFRLIHKGIIPSARLPPGYTIVDVDIVKEAEDVSRFITQCYTDLHPSAETVKSWIEHPVFDKNLWIWINNENNNNVGLGIAERDLKISEGSLEWIQVLPRYRDSGIGRYIVVELLKRLQETVEFTTVSGEYKYNLRQFYESCNFKGEDIWWVLRTD